MKKITSFFFNPYIMLGILSLVTGLILYSECIWGNKILAYNDWGYDTKHSYLPAYEALVRGLKNHNIEFYDFSYGLGTTWAARMMLLLDPFCLIIAIICAIFDSLSMGILLVYMQLFKAIVGGELCLIFLKQHKCSHKAAVLVSYIFSFCGYMIATGQHYMYSTLPVLAVLNLITVNYYLMKGKRGFLIFSSALAANMGPYVAFPIYLMIAFYACIRVGLKNSNSIISKMAELFKTGILVLIGLSVSACSFLLQAYDILMVSARISDVPWIEKIKNGFFWVPREYIRTGFLRFFSNNLEGTVNNWNGARIHFSAPPYFFSVLFLLCAGQFLYGIWVKNTNRKKRIVLFSLVLLFIFSICNAFIPMMLNAFAALEYRYVFVWLPFFALLMAQTLDQIFWEDTFSQIINFFIVVLSILAVNFMTNNVDTYALKSKYAAFVSLFISAVILALCKAKRITKSAQKNRIAFVALFIVVSIELLIDNRIVLYADRSMLTKEEYLDSYWDPDMKELVDYINEVEGDNFVRVERTYLGYSTPDVMLSALFPYRSVSIYNSTLNSNIVEYAEKFFPEYFGGVTQIAYNIKSYGVPFNVVVATNLGIKYLISDCERNINGWDLVKTCNNRFLYENTFIKSAGLIYPKAISQSTFEAMSQLNKKAVMSQAIVLDDKSIDMENNDEEGIYYEKVDNAIIQITNQEGVTKKENVTSIESIYGSTIEILFDTLKLNTEYEQVFLKATISSNNTTNISVTYNNGVLNTLTETGLSFLCLESNSLTKEIILPLIQDTAMIKIESSETDIKIEDIEVFSSFPMNCYNDSISFKNKNMGNIVEGNVDLMENVYLMMPIVYEKGWHVYVDGAETEILRANFGLSAVELEKGSHSIVFEYKSPILNIAIAIMCIGWGCIMVMIFGNLYERYMHYKDK